MTADYLEGEDVTAHCNHCRSGDFVARTEKLRRCAECAREADAEGVVDLSDMALRARSSQFGENPMGPIGALMACAR